MCNRACVRLAQLLVQMKPRSRPDATAHRLACAQQLCLHYMKSFDGPVASHGVGWLQAEQEGNTPLKAAKKAAKETAGAAAQRGDKGSSGSSAQQVRNCIQCLRLDVLGL